MARANNQRDIGARLREDWNRDKIKYVYLIVSLAVGLFQMLRIDFRFIPFGLFLGDRQQLNDFLAWAIPALIAGLLGYLRAKPKEIWSYGLLIWMPRALRVGLYWMTYHHGIFAVVVLFLLSTSLAAVAAVLASYMGFVLRKIANRIWGAPEETPSIFEK
jgi:hypothetical protein